MGTQLQTQMKALSTPKPSLTSVQTQLLQRKCACGGSPGVDGECTECRSKRLASSHNSVDTPTIQAKLTVNQPGDRYEQEADRVAERVMRMPELASSPPSVLQQQSAENDEDEELHRQQMEDEEETIQAKESPGQTPQVTPGLQTRINTLKGGGQPLSQSTRAFMEPRFGHDFSKVRIHTDAQAAETARAVSARAYTLGRDIAFGAGQYAPGTSEGKRLLAHELTHVVQQREQNVLLRQKKEQKHESEPAATKKVKMGLTVPPGCIPTSTSGGKRSSSSSIDVSYQKDNTSRGEITLRQRENGDRVLHQVPIPPSPNVGHVTIPAGIPISNEDHHYELEMIFFNSKGTPFGGLHPRPGIKFEICTLFPAPKGENLLFAKAIFAEGVDAGEFPRVRDVVFNRIRWVKDTCPGDKAAFGDDISSALHAPGQFASVLKNTPKFQQLETELNHHSGHCHYTTPPRSTDLTICPLINAAIQTVAEGDRRSHGFIYFRSKPGTPSDRAVSPPSRYPNGNFYWKISDCPEDKQPKKDKKPKKKP